MEHEEQYISENSNKVKITEDMRYYVFKFFWTHRYLLFSYSTLFFYWQLPPLQQPTPPPSPPLSHHHHQYPTITTTNTSTPAIQIPPQHSIHLTIALLQQSQMPPLQNQSPSQPLRYNTLPLQPPPSPPL